MCQLSWFRCLWLLSTALLLALAAKLANLTATSRAAEDLTVSLHAGVDNLYGWPVAAGSRHTVHNPKQRLVQQWTRRRGE
jgi:hypothetical protein